MMHAGVNRIIKLFLPAWLLLAANVWAGGGGAEPTRINPQCVPLIQIQQLIGTLWMFYLYPDMETGGNPEFIRHVVFGNHIEATPQCQRTYLNAYYYGFCNRLPLEGFEAWGECGMVSWGQLSMPQLVGRSEGFSMTLTTTPDSHVCMDAMEFSFEFDATTTGQYRLWGGGTFLCEVPPIVFGGLTGQLLIGPLVRIGPGGPMVGPVINPSDYFVPQ